MPNLPTNNSIQPIAMGWKSGTLFSTLITGMAYPLLVDADSGRLLCDIGSNIQVSAQFPTVQTVQGTVSLATGTSIGITSVGSITNALPSGNNIMGAVNCAAGSVTMTSGIAGTTSSALLAGSSATKFLAIQNTGSVGTIYISTTSPATATNGIALSAGQGYEFPFIPSNALYVIGNSASIPYTLIYA